MTFLSAGRHDQAYHLQTLGDLSLTSPEGEPIRLRSRKGLLLLAFLAADPDHPWTRDQLATILWADHGEEQARNSLRTALSDIRRQLGEDAVLISGNAVKINAGRVITDVGRLRALAALKHKWQADDFNTLFAGEFLPGFETGEDPLALSWVTALRAKCADLAESVLQSEIRTAIADGQLETAIHWARKLLALDPFREESHRILMRLYADGGERSKAISQFQTCRNLLRQELGVEPSPETISLADDIALRQSAVSSDLHQFGSRIAAQVLPPASASAVQRETDGSVLAAETPSIAVVPFVNLTGDADQNYLADGIVEDIVTDLSDISNLLVAPTSATAMFRNASMPADRVARELGVQYVLEGSVRKSNRNVRVTAKLIEGRSNRQMWAQRYDRELVEIFDLQSEIAANVANTLKLQLVPLAEMRSAGRGRENIEAHENYLRGRGLMREMTRHSLILAQQAFERSIALDPDYALAMAGLAECITLLRWHYDGGKELLTQAADLSARALAIDPDLAEAHCSRGLIHSLQHQFEEAEFEFQQAIARVPSLHEAHLYRGLMYVLVGRPLEGYPSMLRAYEIKSQDLHTSMMMICCLAALGRDDERRATARDVLKLARRRIALNPYDERAIYVGAMALHALGETEEAMRWARVAASFEIEDARTTYNIGCLFARLGQVTEALEYLRRTLQFGASPGKITWMRYHDSDFDTIRDDPRFVALFE